MSDILKRLEDVRDDRNPEESVQRAAAFLTKLAERQGGGE